MGSNAYKYFNETDKALVGIWRLFPSFRGIPLGQRLNTGRINANIDKYIFSITRNSSKEFCTLLNENTLHVTQTAQGGFSRVGILQINEDQMNQPVYAINVSLGPRGGFHPFYVPVIIKQSNK